MAVSSIENERLPKLEESKMRILFAIMLLSLTILPGNPYAADSRSMGQKDVSVSDNKKAVVPVGHRTALGVDQIRAKEKAAKGSSKRGTAKLKGYFNGFLNGMNSVSHSLSNPDGKVLTAKQKEKRLSFKEQLKLEMERKRQRNNVSK